MAKRQGSKKETVGTYITQTILKRVKLKPNQLKYKNAIYKNNITFCYGPAGTAKTFGGVYTALEMLMDNTVHRIILTKPIVEAGENLGFLPGDKDDKMGPHVKSFADIVEKIIGVEGLNFLIEQGLIVYEPLAYMRGRSFDKCLMFLDEAQNATFKQLMLFITRMGQGSKMVIAGDISQYDIKMNAVGLPKFIDLVDGEKGVGTHIFDSADNMRHVVVRRIIDKYEKWKANEQADKGNNI